LYDLINKIKKNIPDDAPTEIILVQDAFNDEYKDYLSKASSVYSNVDQQSIHDTIVNDSLVPIRRIQNSLGKGIISALAQGIKYSSGDNVIVMNDNFSHPPEMIPCIIQSLLDNPNCIVVASRQAKARSLRLRTFLGRVLSPIAERILPRLFNLGKTGPKSDYIAFPKKVINYISLDEKGYSPSIEERIRKSGLRVIEIPYTFAGNAKTTSKLIPSLIDYTKTALHHYIHGPKSNNDLTNLKHGKSVMFFSKAARFYTVGASGLLINYTISSVLTNGMFANLWYMEATLIGILASITSNFLLNKVWTFQDRNFSFYHTIRQFILFSGFSCLGAFIQLGLVYVGVETGSRYWTSLLFAMGIASISNFLLNKKWTFNEVLWG
jgi:dolichol-phosphate mannosyltransferase